MNQRSQRLSLDSTFEVLSSAERRRLLLALAESSPRDVADVRTDDRNDQVSMHHVHLPKLADADLVEVSDDGRRVSRGPAFDDVEPVLRFLDEYRAPSSSFQD